jgi:hypothetical protein
MRAASALTLRKPCQSKKINDLNDVAVLPGSGRQTLLCQRATMTRQILPPQAKK